MDISKEDLVEILKIIEESSYDEVRLESKELTIHVRRGSSPSQLSPTTRLSSLPGTQTADAAERSTQAGRLVEVRAPMLGTFYRAPSPEAPPFVQVGDMVKPGDTLCLIEVMKLFNSVKAEISGQVIKVVPENSSLVEFGDVLILIEESRQ